MFSSSKQIAAFPRGVALFFVLLVVVVLVAAAAAALALAFAAVAVLLLLLLLNVFASSSPNPHGRLESTACVVGLLRPAPLCLRGTG